MKIRAFAIVAALASGGWAMPAAADEPFLGEIMMTGNNFCPRNWADANGQFLPIDKNQALFALLGTTYGGDGRTTFGLPDLRGRAPVHFGQGPGLPAVKQGQKLGHNPVASAGTDPNASRTPPTLAVRFCIALSGIFPSRN